MAIFVVAHGAWSSSWAWRKMRPLMRAAGHELYVPAYTGLGERRHLASRDITLGTHVADVLGVLEMEDLRDVILVGHSYGGMVATSVADRARERIAHLVYLDAFVPRDGQSLLDMHPQDHRLRLEAVVRDQGQGWLVPPQPPPPDTSPEDIAWIAPRRLPQPFGTFTTPFKAQCGELTLPRTYIFCTKVGPADSFRQFSRRFQSEPGWRYRELEASHNPHITIPDRLMALLEEVAASSAPSAHRTG